MFSCPVCMCGVEAYSRLDVGKHLRSHIDSRDYPDAFSLKCSQNDCASFFVGFDGYVKYFHIKHTVLYACSINRRPNELVEPPVDTPVFRSHNTKTRYISKMVLHMRMIRQYETLIRLFILMGQ